MNEELQLLRTEHPAYSESDFESAEDFALWKSRRMASIQRKIKAFEKIQPFTGKLKIRILNAKELGGALYCSEAANCNIFCVIKVGTNSQKTSAKKGSWNPLFGESFDFDVNAIDTRIKIEVWDKKMIGSSFLGCVVTNPSELMWDNMPIEKWYTLTSRPRSNDTGVSGSIQLKINLNFRLGPAKKSESTSDSDDSKPLSKVFNFKNQEEENKKFKRKKIEKLGVFNYAEYYRYLLMIILLEACEQETRKLEEREGGIGIPFKRGHRIIKDGTEIGVSPSKQHLRTSSDILYQSSSSPNFSSIAQLSLRKTGTLRNNDKGDPVKPPPELQWILDNFLDRFSVSQSFSNLVLIEVLVSSFTLTCDHLTMIHFSLMELEAEKNNEFFLWKREAQLYEKYVQNELRNNLEEALSSYFLRFPDNKPEGALSIVIVLYSLLTDSSRLCQLLTEKTEAAMIKMYKAVVGDRPTEETLIDACKFVSAVLDDDDEYFNNVFPPEVKHTIHAVNIYYSEMLSKNIKSLLRTSPPISENIMSLYTQLKKLNQKAFKINPDIEIMPLSQMFQPFVSKWIERIGDQLPSWCNSVLKEEKWKALSLDEFNPVLHSISVQELFDIIYELYSTYKDFEMRAAKDLKNLQKIIEKTIDAYIKGILSLLTDSLNAPKTISPSGSFDKPPDDQSNSKTKHVPVNHKIASEYCTWIMNLEVITLRLYEFCTHIVSDGEKGAEESKHQFGELFSRLRQAQDQVTYHIIYKFNQNPLLETALESFIGNPPENINKVSNNEILARMDPLFQYINSCVKILCENLDFKVCLRVIEQIYLFLIKDIEAMLYPSIPGKKTEHRGMVLVERSYPFLIEFFFANGEGLPVQHLEKVSETLKSAFEMSKLSTATLIKTYTDLENGLKPQGSNYVGIDPINMELEIIYILNSRKSDKEAKKFAKLHKETTVYRAIIKSFGLPSTESMIEWFTCKKGKRENIPGYLYITTNYICFDTFLITGQQIKVCIKDLKHVKRKRGSMSTITLVLKDGEHYVLHSINKTKVYDIIDSQAEAIGTKLEKIEYGDKSKKVGTDSPTKAEARANNGAVVETKDSTSKQKDSTSKQKKESSKKKKKKADK